MTVLNKRCSKCGKRVWFWQNSWSLSHVNEKSHDYWHNKCARPVHELRNITLDVFNNYIKSITNFTFHSIGIGGKNHD